MPEKQIGEDPTSALGKLPAGPSVTGSTEETPSASPDARAREVPAENSRTSPKQSVDEPQPSTAMEQRQQGCGISEQHDADDGESSVPPGTSGSVPIRSLRTGPSEEVLSASQPALVSDEQADRLRSSPAQDSERAATVGAGCSSAQEEAPTETKSSHR